MALPNLTINIENGNLGRTAQTSDGVAGLIVTGAAGEGFELDTPYALSSLGDLEKKGVDSGNNPLLHKEVAEFYRKAGSGAELYVLAVEKVVEAGQGDQLQIKVQEPIDKLMAFAKGRIRLLGLNWNPTDYNSANADYDSAFELVAEKVQAIAEDYAAQVNPFRAFVPAFVWKLDSTGVKAPRSMSFNRVGFVMACDRKLGEKASPAIGQVLGTAASIPVHYSIGRVKNGMAALEGTLSDGRTPEEYRALLDTLDQAGYILYRSFVGRSGYYFNDDAMAAPLSDDYSNLNYGRVIDKAVILAYNAYVAEILDSVEVDENGNIPAALCSYYEGLVEKAVGAAMGNEISSFTAYIDPAQDLLSTSRMVINCRIVPKGVLREIIVNLGFQNPSNNNQ